METSIAFLLNHFFGRWPFYADEKIVNSIPKLHSHWKYNIDTYQVEVGGSTDREKMILDLENSENVIMWAFENIEIC